jgi:hypothetical protein
MITVPDKLYVGLQKREKDTPLGFVTPDTGDAAFKKRKATVDDWAYDNWHRQNAKKIPPLSLTNELVEGYVIADDIRRYGWGKGNVVWRMVDPRGFEFEISSANMASIIDCTTIKNGLIEGKCIFGREGAQNVLLPENSQPYKDATVNTARVKTKISMKDVKIGDKLLLKDGSEVIFAGMRKVLSETTKRTNDPNNYRSMAYEHDLFDLRQRYIVIKTAGENDTWLRGSGNFMPKGRQYLSSFGDLHVSEILERGLPIDAKLWGTIPETPTSTRNAQAYGMFDVKTKITDFYITLREITFDNVLSMMKKSLSYSDGSLEGTVLWSDGISLYNLQRYFAHYNNNAKVATVDLHMITKKDWERGKYTVENFNGRNSSDERIKLGKFYLIDVVHKDGTVVNS